MSLPHGGGFVGPRRTESLLALLLHRSNPADNRGGEGLMEGCLRAFLFVCLCASEHLQPSSPLVV